MFSSDYNVNQKSEPIWVVLIPSALKRWIWRNEKTLITDNSMPKQLRHQSLVYV